MGHVLSPNTLSTYFQNLSLPIRTFPPSQPYKLPSRKPGAHYSFFLRLGKKKKKLFYILVSIDPKTFCKNYPFNSLDPKKFHGWRQLLCWYFACFFSFVPSSLQIQLGLSIILYHGSSLFLYLYLLISLPYPFQSSSPVFLSKF